MIRKPNHTSQNEGPKGKPTAKSDAASSAISPAEFSEFSVLRINACNPFDNHRRVPTPADVHFGLTTEVDQVRHHAMQTAWQTNPERFAKHQLPKTLQLPAAAWINQPTELSQQDTQLAGRC